MSREKLKVLEMVAEGKISPEEGIRLIEALGEADRVAGPGARPPHGMHVELPDIRIPKIDLGQLGEIVMELKNTVLDTANRATGSFRRTRTGQVFKLNDYPIAVECPPQISQCNLGLEMRAGKMKLRCGDTGGMIVRGKLKRAPDEPIVLTEVRNGRSEVQVKAKIGRALLRLNPELAYKVNLDSAAADARVDLSEARVDGVDIDNNAGSVYLVLGGKADRIEVDVNNNAGHVRLGVPAAHAVRVTPSGSLSNTNLERCGLEVVDGVAKSADWNDNPHGVDILLHQNVASFQLDWKRRDGTRLEDDFDDGDGGDEDDE
jgi:hypothetical protein